MQQSVECAFFRRRLSSQALRKYEEKFSILMLNPTRFPELRELVRANGDSFDILREFSGACREEFDALRTIVR